MRVVVDHGDPARFAHEVEAALHAGEVGQRFGRLRRVVSERPQKADDAGGVQHVVTARILLDVRAHDASVGQFEREVAAHAVRLVRGDAHVARIREAVGEQALSGGASHAHERLVLAAGHHHAAVVGHRPDERGELLVDLVEVAVVVEVVGLDVRHQHGARRQMHERLVALVCLHHVMGARSRVRVRAVGAHDAAYEERRILPHAVQHAGQHGRRGGFAVRAGHRERLERASQIGEHLGAMPDGQAARLGGGEFGVVVEDGGGHDDHGVSLGDVRRIVADVHLDARLAQLLGVAALLEVGAAHAHALVERDASDAAHADASNADEMYLVDVHGVHSASSVSLMYCKPLLYPIARPLNAVREPLP